ncbi:Na-translocating system protein MpsC family protein [Sutcliffiella rhizosphaerae]|uniref:Na+-translocating membrane potential-generating system MpsC domain-containing protein n=1 Tax=Sutcliffiella rhizosphaerae TaxID=2880967 RepID=A0ABM8YTB5_9BACI|nr:Na-translocating system protein MpsC family protein [Sutcliffiella rhizosphaerae]CAG9623223.1 hypothetical protein BACCIP111883_04019 [Sutcliffiella rhizosphaerae]
MTVKAQQSELSSEIGRILRKYFGKGPEAVLVSIAPPYVTIYLRNFLSPIEQVLLEDRHTMTVEEIRDKMMEKLASKMLAVTASVTGFNVMEFYYDWSFENGSGILVGVEESQYEKSHYPYKHSTDVEELIDIISEEAEKSPESIYSHLLNERTLLIVREGILVKIEKQLIESGFVEALTVAKRTLEKKLLFQHKSTFAKYLNTEIKDIFVSWDFEIDKSIIVFILAPKK